MQITLRPRTDAADGNARINDLCPGTSAATIASGTRRLTRPAKRILDCMSSLLPPSASWRQSIFRRETWARVLRYPVAEPIGSLLPQRDSLNVPYCGTAPLPVELWSRWNLDPVLILVLLAVALLYVAALRGAKARRPAGASQRWRARAFHAGLGLTALALISPLCSLSVALFSARVSQHMLLLLVAAPLLAFSWPRHARARPSFAWASFAALLWLWHTPYAYAATFESSTIYWVMHLSMLASAVLLWRVVLPGVSGTSPLTSLLAGFTTLLHMGVLGALITFAPALLYAPHVVTTQPYGLTPLQDQQLGGLIMWIPGAGAFLAAALACVAQLLHPQPSAQKPR